MTSGLPVIEARDKANLVELKKRQNPAKNLFGATSYLYRLAKNAHDGFRHSPDGSASYSAFTDFLGHKDLGEKTILFIIDGLYGNDNVDGPLAVNGRWGPSTMRGQIASSCRLTAWRSIQSASIF
jgi:hypothetical protein